MRVGLLTQWYDPEPGPAAIPGVLARGLAQRGHEVSVVTGVPNYPTGRVMPGYRIRRRQDEVMDGVMVRRVALYPSHDSSTLRRLLNYASFGLSAPVNGLTAMRGLDALWVNYSPITVALPMWAARYGLGVPQVAHVLDLWPDTLLAGGFSSGGRMYRLAEPVLAAWCRGMYGSAESVAYISPAVGTILEQRGVPASKLRYVPMWADEAIFRPTSQDLRAQLGIDPESVVLLYAGALGEAQGLRTLIDACGLVTDDRFVCLIAGSGIAEGSLRHHADSVGALNVRFLGRMPQAEMTQLFATGDLNYIGLRAHPSSSYTMPSKTQAGLASGKALLAAVEGDLANLVRDNGLGFVADPSDPRSICSAITTACGLGRGRLREMGSEARRYYEREFSAARGVTQVETLLEAAATTRRRKWLTRNP